MTAAEIDNNAVERALRVVALGRKNFLFAGSDGGGESAATIYSLVGSAKLNGIDPESYLRNVLSRIADHPYQSHRGVVTLERRGKSEAPDTRGSVNEEATSNHQTSGLSELAYIEETIARGAITIGVVPPLKECVAIAHEGRHTLAMLKRQKGELVGENVFGVGAGDGKIQTGQQLNPVNMKRP